MSSTIRVADALHAGTASALVAVPFVPYLAVGEQPYAAVGFIERINALVGTQFIDGSWMMPPVLALITSLSALVVIASPRRHRTKAHVTAAFLATVSAYMAFYLTGHSTIFTPLIGPKLLVIGAALSVSTIAVERISFRRTKS